MKKNIIIVLLTAMIFLCIGICIGTGKISFSSNEYSTSINANSKDFNITYTENAIAQQIFNEGCVRDEKDAAAIASVIFQSVYGINYDHGLPLIVDYDDKQQTWLIKTQLPEDKLGKTHYLIIKKSNAEVVAIWGTK